VWGILRKPAYKGTACFGKTEVQPRQRVTQPLRMRGGIAKRNSANHERPRKEWIEIPVPAIVSEETLSCSKCGYALSARTSARKIYYYRCLGSDRWRHLHGAVCDNPPIREELLDHAVWNEIVKLLENPCLIEEELDRRLEVAQKASPTKRRQESLQRDLARVRT
jgi:site-specific DNA recombinase